MNILENIKVGDWVCCDRAQADLRCRKVVKRTPCKIWTDGYPTDKPFRLDGKRHRGDQYPVRPATPEDLAAWEAAKAATIARRKQAELDKQESVRQGRIRDEAENLLTCLENLLAEFDRYDAAMAEIGRGHEDYGGQREAARVAILRAKKGQ